MDKKYKFRALKVYGDTEWLAEDKKKYRKVFDRYETEYIYAEFSFYNKWVDIEDWELDLQLRCYRGRKEVCIIDLSTKTVSKENPVCYRREGWGNNKPGSFWIKGAYTWEAWIGEEKIATSHFYIEDAGRPLIATDNPYFEIEHFKLFEAPKEGRPLKERSYVRQFDTEETRYVTLEAVFLNRNLKNNWNCRLVCNFYNQARELKGASRQIIRVEEDSKYIALTLGWGANEKGSWSRGHYIAEVIFMNQLLATIDFTVGTAFIPAKALPFKVSTIADPSIILPKQMIIQLQDIPVQLHTALQQYLLFFRDFVELAKAESIAFEIRRRGEHLEFLIEHSTHIPIFQKYIYEYLTFAKSDYVDTIEVETKQSAEVLDLLKMRLEQQIYQFNMELKFKELNLNTLQGKNYNALTERNTIIDRTMKAFRQTLGSVKIPAPEN